MKHTRPSDYMSYEVVPALLMAASTFPNACQHLGEHEVQQLESGG